MFMPTIYLAGLSDLVLLTVLRDRGHYLCFIKEETEAQQFESLVPAREYTEDPGKASKAELAVTRPLPSPV